MSILTLAETVLRKLWSSTFTEEVSKQEQTLVLIAWIIHGRPIQDVSLTTLHELCSHAMRDTALGVWFAYFWRGSGDFTFPGFRPLWKASPSLTYRVVRKLLLRIRTPILKPCSKFIRDSRISHKIEFWKTCAPWNWRQSWLDHLRIDKIYLYVL